MASISNLDFAFFTAVSENSMPETSRCKVFAAARMWPIANPISKIFFVSGLNCKMLF